MSVEGRPARVGPLALTAEAQQSSLAKGSEMDDVIVMVRIPRCTTCKAEGRRKSEPSVAQILVTVLDGKDKMHTKIGYLCASHLDARPGLVDLGIAVPVRKSNG